MKKYLLLSLLVFASFSSIYAQSWQHLGNEANGIYVNGYNGISATCVDLAGNLYAGGLNDVGPGQMELKKWNGTSWSVLGSSPCVLDSLAEINTLYADAAGNIYIGGAPRTSTSGVFIIKWDGSTFTTMNIDHPIVSPRDVNSICTDNAGNVYVAGAFINTAGYNYVTKWDGVKWQEIGALNANSYINTIRADAHGNVYAAGSFTDSSNATGGNFYVAEWDGSSWTKLGSTGVFHQKRTNCGIFTMAINAKGNIYVAGNSDYPVMGNYLSMWDGTSWSRIENTSSMLNANDDINSISLDDKGNIYAGGNFTNALHRCYVAKWDGTAWSELGGSNSLNANGKIYTVISDKAGNVYCAGTLSDSAFIKDTSAHYPPLRALPYYVAAFNAGTVGIHDLQTLKGITVFPNPVSNQLNINGLVESADYNIISSSGQVMMQGTLGSSKTNINIRKLPTGNYVLNLCNKKGEQTIVKFVKE